MLKRTKAGGSAFGVALVSMLVLGAFAAGAAQAAPTWHVDGIQYTGKANVTWGGAGGSTEFKADNGWKITCGTASGTSSISEGKYSQGKLTFSSCTFAGWPTCVVKPLNLFFYSELVGVGEDDFEKLTASAGSEWTIEGCALKTTKPVSGTIASDIGEEAKYSTRKFAHLYDVVTKSSGLSFYGHTWEVTSDVYEMLTGSLEGSRFGTGGAWVAPGWSVWTVGGEEFYEGETVKLSKVTPVTLTNEIGETLQCETSEGSGLDIQNETDSSGQMVLKNCWFPEYPSCVVNGETPNITMNTEGYIGRDAFLQPWERVDVRGTLTLTGPGCPMLGALSLSGSVAASLTTNGIALKKQFGTKAEAATGAPGLQIGGEPWSLSTEVETVLSGPNSGKALGVS